MVVEMPAHGEVGEHVDAEPREVCGGADPRAHQDRGAGVRARGEDHLAGRDLRAAGGDDADRPAPVEQDAVDLDTAGDLKVGAVADVLGEVHEPGVLPDAADDVDRVRAGAGRVGPVEVLDAGEPLRRGRVDEPAHRAGQVAVPQLPYRERPVRPR
jgi:hypothetical protein